MAEIAGAGVTLWYGETSAVFTAASSGWTKIAKITDITPPDSSMDDIDNSHAETTNQSRTFQAGWVDEGELAATIIYDKTVYSTLLGIRGDEKKFRILYSDGSGVGWTGYLKSISNPVDIEGLVTSDIAAKVSGEVTAISATS